MRPNIAGSSFLDQRRLTMSDTGWWPLQSDLRRSIAPRPDADVATGHCGKATKLRTLGRAGGRLLWRGPRHDRRALASGATRGAVAATERTAGGGSAC